MSTMRKSGCSPRPRSVERGVAKSAHRKARGKKKALGAPVLADKIDMPKSELEVLARA
jgi:hypothetical protein